MSGRRGPRFADDLLAGPLAFAMLAVFFYLVGDTRMTVWLAVAGALSAVAWVIAFHERER